MTCGHLQMRAAAVNLVTRYATPGAIVAYREECLNFSLRSRDPSFGIRSHDQIFLHFPMSTPQATRHLNGVLNVFRSA